MILHIETATKICSVALSQQGKCIALKEDDGENFTHSEHLTLFIESLLKENSASFQDLTAISVTSGPGSYTGLRIGVSTAKGLCYALNIPLISVDSLTSLAQQVNGIDQNICAVIDARRMEVFGAIFSKDKSIIKPISSDILTAESYQEFEPFIIIGDGAEKLQEIWKGRNNITFDLTIQSSASGQISEAHKKFENSNFEDLAYFEPFYLKDFK